MSYAKYPKEMKEAVIARMLQGDETVTDIQRDTGIGINTLYRWRDKALNQNGLSATTKYKNADKWSSQDKFTVVIETANLSEIEFSEYCREKGIYPEQVKEWKEACINANDNAREKIQKQAKNFVKNGKKRKIRKRACPKRKGISGSRSTVSVEKKSRCDLGDGTKITKVIRTNDQRFRSQTSSRVDHGSGRCRRCLI